MVTNHARAGPTCPSCQHTIHVHRWKVLIRPNFKRRRYIFPKIISSEKKLGIERWQWSRDEQYNSIGLQRQQKCDGKLSLSRVSITLDRLTDLWNDSHDASAPCIHASRKVVVIYSVTTTVVQTSTFLKLHFNYIFMPEMVLLGSLSATFT